MTYPVYDIVLLPPPLLNAKAIAISQQLSVNKTQFTLSKTLHPHISLYMANLSPEGLQKTSSLLENLSRRTPAQVLKATHYSQNEHGMFEVFFEKTAAITTLQQDVITLANPLRVGLRQKDPVGRDLAQYLHTAPREARENLEHFGYDEIGNFFKPHITLTRFMPGARMVATDALPQPLVLSGVYATLALCEMGEHGTCTKIVSQFLLT